jgi:hypothetical protein
MTSPRGALPTLTEVIDIEADALVSGFGPAVQTSEALPLEERPIAPVDPAIALTTQVLETLRPRIDALLEARLQAVIAPQLARLSDDILRSLRSELATAMRLLVAQAVDDLLARRRKP